MGHTNGLYVYKRYASSRSSTFLKMASLPKVPNYDLPLTRKLKALRLKATKTIVLPKDFSQLLQFLSYVFEEGKRIYMELFHLRQVNYRVSCQHFKSLKKSLQSLEKRLSRSADQNIKRFYQGNGKFDVERTLKSTIYVVNAALDHLNFVLDLPNEKVRFIDHCCCKYCNIYLQFTSSPIDCCKHLHLHHKKKWNSNISRTILLFFWRKMRWERNKPSC